MPKINNTTELPTYVISPLILLISKQSDCQVSSLFQAAFIRTQATVFFDNDKYCILRLKHFHFFAYPVCSIVFS